jgi:membrane protein implicated in regulation of membrane protease activity
MSADAYALIWIVLALLAIVVELHSRTIYLLALAAALGVAAGLGFAQAALGSQLLALALVCLAGFPVATWVRRHQAHGVELASADIGQEVRVVAETSSGLRVFYRGSVWDAIYTGPAATVGDHLRIAALRGSVLELAPK